MSLGLTDDKSTLVQVMAWCRQATSHYLNQCWPRSPTPNGITRPQWVKEDPFVAETCSTLLRSGWGLQLIKHFPTFTINSYLAVITQQHHGVLTVEYHIHISQLPLQLSCGDNCHIWTWFKGACISVISKLPLTEKLTQIFVTLDPCTISLGQVHIMWHIYRWCPAKRDTIDMVW